MSDIISFLPLEIVLQILSHLPFESLLAFGETSRINYQSHILCFRCLRLGVFEKRTHSIISCLQAGWIKADQLGDIFPIERETGSDYTISIIRPKIKPTKHELSSKRSLKAKDARRRCPTDPSVMQDQTVRAQNKIFSRLVNRYGPSLVKLEFMAYDIHIESAMALGTKCQYLLRHLALRFEHQHIRDGNIKPSTWRHPAPCSIAWNLLIGIGQYKHIGISGLKTLILERAGITPWQLTMLVKKNPDLTVLKLKTCHGAQPDFLNWLGGIEQNADDLGDTDSDTAPGDRLEVLWLENCHQILTRSIEGHEDFADKICDTGLEWVRGLRNLNSLSFSKCMNLPSEYVERANKTIWKIPDVTLPFYNYEEGTPIEVDPIFL
ncbi:F-box domain protein [Aspergillus coremiiformis]|uniref:F-box domain protein n=1 Tax=Aspergillus coremiiformis TaxID=138285 RepID=A0A5N6Z3P3_9EURO|nr:F-box domain protein [Aspergillus coremiiformis]